jgi:serine/threonine-protein kinase
MAWPEAVSIALALTEALAHVHERTDPNGKAIEIVHRDLSPQNVMVGYAGDVKLIDFGTARGENRRCQTVSGIVFAKPGYVAPEVANQNQPGPPADLYALGIILWELLMGRRFLNSDPAEHLAQVAAGLKNPQAVSMSNNVPLALDTAIARLTAPDLRDRYPSAREAAADLNRVLGRAPSLADGERNARARISHLMGRLYPAEPARSRSEFAKLVAESRQQAKPTRAVPESPTPGDVTELLPGTRYRIDREISRSAMSVVYEATHIDLGRRVALKVLPKEHCDNPHFEARFRSEARAIAQLRHNNLVTLHDFGVSQDGRAYYAMELLEGETLKEASERLPRDWKRALTLAIQVCDALSVAHAIGFVHRDIKPANLFITTSGTVKLIDFGVAQVGAEVHNDEHSNALRVTGTPEYMAPEQVGDTAVDVRADIFALGAVIYELLTGKLPHQGESTVQLLNNKQTRPAQPLKTADGTSHFPPQLEWVLSKALALNPAQRFESAAQLKEALELALRAPERLKRTQRIAGSVALAAAGIALTLVAWPTTVRSSFLAAGPTFAPIGANLSAAARLPFELPQQTAGNFARAPGAGMPVEEAAAAHEELEVANELDLPGELEVPDELKVPAPLEAADALNAAGVVEVQPAPNAAGTAEAPAELKAPTDVAVEAIALAAAPAAEGNSAANVAVSEPATPLPANVQAELERAGLLADRDGEARLQALDIYRKLGATYPDRKEVLLGWSRTAGRAKWWGEALRVALHWARTDPSPEAQLHLARTQRLLGQRYGAIQTLERLLAHAPSHGEATAMLQRYRKD